MTAAAGLHRESLLESEEQLAMLAAQLQGTVVPASLALLQVQAQRKTPLQMHMGLSITCLGAAQAYHEQTCSPACPHGVLRGVPVRDYMLLNNRGDDC